MSKGFTDEQREYMEEYDVIGTYWDRWAHGATDRFPDFPHLVRLPQLIQENEGDTPLRRQWYDYLRVFYQFQISRAVSVGRRPIPACAGEPPTLA